MARQPRCGERFAGLVAALALLQSLIMIGASFAQAPAGTRTVDPVPESIYLKGHPATLPVSLSVLIHQQRWAEAAELAEKFTLEHPRESTGFYWLGVARQKLHDPVRAIQALRSAERLGLGTPAFHIVLGIAYYNLHQFVLFEEQMQMTIRSEPFRYEPYYYLGIYYEDVLNRWEHALELFHRAAELEPDDPRSMYGAGYCLEALGKRDEAAKAYEESIGLIERNSGRFSGPHQGMARLLLDADPYKALPFAHKALELEPSSPSNHVILAKAYERVGRLTEAVEELQLAAYLSPTDPSPRFALARVYEKLGRSEAAGSELQMFEKLTRIYGP